MQKYITPIQDLFVKIYSFIVRHRVTLFIVVCASLLSIMLIDITRMADADPTAIQVDDAEKSVKIIQFKKESIDVIESLDDQNIEIDTLFDPNRTDPFN